MPPTPMGSIHHAGSHSGYRVEPRPGALAAPIVPLAPGAVDVGLLALLFDPPLEQRATVRPVLTALQHVEIHREPAQRIRQRVKSDGPSNPNDGIIFQMLALERSSTAGPWRHSLLRIAYQRSAVHIKKAVHRQRHSACRRPRGGAPVGDHSTNICSNP
jgi:hypothetical protein